MPEEDARVEENQMMENRELMELKRKVQNLKAMQIEEYNQCKANELASETPEDRQWWMNIQTFHFANGLAYETVLDMIERLL